MAINHKITIILHNVCFIYLIIGKIHKLTTIKKLQLIITNSPTVYMQFFSESPAPWKRQQESVMSAIKISTSEITTVEVVDSPTPLAPPVSLPTKII